MKITPADNAFSNCIRERSGWTCERCGAQHEVGSSGLHCAHFEGRWNWATRFEPANCFALCYGCHRLLDGRKLTFEKFFIEKRGQDTLEWVWSLARDVDLERAIRRTKGLGEIAKHYRFQYIQMETKRAFENPYGYLNFERWKP